MQKQVLLERVRVAAEAFRAATAPHTTRIEKLIAATTSVGFAAAKAPLVAHLATEPELAIFNELMVVFRNSSRRATYKDLAQWLADHAATVGAEKAVQDLERYLNEPQFEYKVHTAIAGLEVAEETPFAPDLLLSGPQALPQYVLDDDPITLRHWHQRSTAALTWTRSQARIHAPESDVKFEDAGSNDPIDDALMCISVVGPYAPAIVGIWYDVPAAPVLGGFGELPRSLEIGWSEKLSKADALAAAELYAVFVALSTGDKERLRVPMRRLNSARRRRDQVDSAIDIGIALEALFGDTNPGEHTFKVRVRAARYLGQDAADRERIYELAGTLYLLRSLAVHRGTLVSKDTKGLDIGQTLQAGYRLVGDALNKIIRKPVGDWRSTVLS